MPIRVILLSDRLTHWHRGSLPRIFVGMEERCPFDDVLDMLRVRGTVMANLRARAPWGLRIPERKTFAMLHAVTAGTCWARASGEAARELLPGDIMLLPKGAAHVLASDLNAPTRNWRSVAKEHGNPAQECVIGEGGSSAHVICAGFQYDHEVAQPLLSLLPPVVFLSGQEMQSSSGVEETLRVLRHELNARTAGSGTVINRLIDVLFVQVLRAWDNGHHSTATSWLQGLRDPGIARALSIMHAQPAAQWTIDALAREVSLSRATLIRRFTALVGEAPLSYLTRWRMDIAARDLRETGDAVSAIAHRVGYTSEFAFSRAFSRLRGRPPGRYRAEVRKPPVPLHRTG